MKNKIITVIFIAYIFIFSLLGIVMQDEVVSISERRKLKTFPDFEINSEYINRLDKYFLDHFPFRDTFRSIKANFNYKVLHTLDNNGIYLHDDYIFKKEYPTNYDSIANFINIIGKLQKNLSSDNHVYMMIIPDKNYYLHDKDFLQIDYDYLYQEVSKLNIQEIDIRKIMTLNDYYMTDTHWRQDKISKVVDKMHDVMGFNYISEAYQEKVYNQFYGVYYGEAALKRKPEKLIYLTSPSIENAKVWYLENKDLTKVYNTLNLESLDGYEVFLDGASSYIEITNDNSLTNKELVIFRDSFASSITPLLINSYKKITLIDNRYIKSNVYLDYIDFSNQDVIFMYSTLIVNNSVTLKG